MAKEFFLSNVRLAFPELWEAKQVNGEGEPAFSCSLLLPRDHPQVAEVRKLEDEVGKEQWKDKWPAIKKEIVANNRLAMKDGDAKASYDGFPDHWFISARNPGRPTVVDRDRTPLLPKDGRPYAGCYVTVKLELWAQDNKYGKRINAKVLGVQYLRKGNAFGAGSAPADPNEFPDLSNQGEDDEEEALA